ncbi:hypothetical protein JOC70_000753 [Clostridium pascui]|uniref:hypothetical protein n=1 Tax=Clostridium pascui TaxID=46609 RepID=UPI00195ECF80|nr:hypothetical protein [Clostridium pascui]MBM7869284.1 hypothetical protein [Clostridium pascui]
MANYDGLIASKGMILVTVRNNNKVGTLVTSPLIIGGVRSTVKQGLDLNNYNFVRFERIPKERVLNRFKNLGGNVRY